MKKWMKTLLVLIGLGVAAAVAMYVFVYNKPHTDYARAKPEIVADARACFDEFVNNRSQAEQKYNGKIVQLSGEITRIEKNDTLMVLVFVFNEGVFGDEGVRCTMLPGFSATAEVQPGERVAVKGLLTGYNETDVIMENCSVVKP